MKSVVSHNFLKFVLSYAKESKMIANMVCISLIVFLSFYAIDRTTLSRIVDFSCFTQVTVVLRFIIFGLGILSCFYENIRKTVACILYFIFSYVTYRLSGAWFLFDLFFIPLFLSKRINLSSVISIFFYVIAIATIITVFLDIYNILPQVSFGQRGKFVRYNLGFAHPNSLGLMLMLLGMLFILKVKYVRFEHLLVPVMLGLICIVVPNSLTPAFILFSLAVSLFLIMKFQNYKFGLTAGTVLGVCLLLFFTAVIIAAYYVSLTGAFKEYIVRLPGAMWARFSLGAEAYTKYGFSLFGQPYHPKDTYPDFFIVDCTYFYLPVFIGIIPSLAYLLLVYRAVWLSIKSNCFNLLIIQILVFIYSISEYIVIYPFFMFIYFSFIGREGNNVEIVNNSNGMKQMATSKNAEKNSCIDA